MCFRDGISDASSWVDRLGIGSFGYFSGGHLCSRKSQDRTVDAPWVWGENVAHTTTLEPSLAGATIPSLERLVVRTLISGLKPLTRPSYKTQLPVSCDSWRLTERGRPCLRVFDDRAKHFRPSNWNLHEVYQFCSKVYTLKLTTRVDGYTQEEYIHLFECMPVALYTTLAEIFIGDTRIIEPADQFSHT